MQIRCHKMQSAAVKIILNFFPSLLISLIIPLLVLANISSVVKKKISSGIAPGGECFWGFRQSTVRNYLSYDWKQIRKSHPISSLFKNSLSFYRIHFGYSLDNRPDNTSIYLCGLGLVSYYSLSSIKGPYPLRGRYSKNKWEYIGILFPRIIIFSGIENKWNVIRMCEISFWSSTTDWLMDFYLFWCCVMRYSYYPGNNIRTSVNLFLDLMW